MEWVDAVDLVTAEPTFLPKELIDLDFCWTNDLCLPRFRRTSNGLAIGNSMIETAMHALCEVLERDSIARNRAHAPAARLMVDLQSVDAPLAMPLIERFLSKGAALAIENITGETGVPVMRVWLWMNDRDPIFNGFGCHPDKEIALLRALTEAAQSRLGYIAGLAANLEPGLYHSRRMPETAMRVNARQFWADISSIAGDSMAIELSAILERVHRVTKRPVLAVDLRNPAFGIPVVTVVVPGMSYDMP